MATTHLTTSEFLEKISNYERTHQWQYLGDKPCIIDFYASWCLPCKAIAPILEDLSIEYGEYLHIYKINTDEEPELAAAFGISCLPTLLFCPMDDAPHITQGSMPKHKMIEQIDSVLLFSEQYVSAY